MGLASCGRCDLTTGELTLDTENPGDVLGWGTEDSSFEVRVITISPRSTSPPSPWTLHTTSLGLDDVALMTWP
jgi:hypothetical protein